MMGKRYRAVVFDWDGTLFDSTGAIVRALQDSFRDFGLPVPEREQAAYVIGLSLQSGLRHLAPQLDAAGIDAFINHYLQHFSQEQAASRLFDGQAALLHRLRAAGTVLGVATGKRRRSLDQALERLRLGAVFDATRCADEARGKPDPDMLLQLLQQFDLPAHDVLMVGDTTHDVQMAQAAGVDSLAVAYGAHDRALLARAAPTALVGTVGAMQAWITARAVGESGLQVAEAHEP